MNASSRVVNAVLVEAEHPGGVGAAPARVHLLPQLVDDVLQVDLCGGIR